MITIKTFVFNPFQENTYIISDDTNECIIIDAGCYTENEESVLVNYITKNKFKVVGLLNTHNHIDHIFGNKFICNKYTIEPRAHKADDILLSTASDYGKMFGVTLQTPPPVKKHINDNDTIKFGESHIKAQHTPGHAPGHLVFVTHDMKHVFTGDVLFKGSIGRTDLPGGDFDTLINSIKEKLMVLNDDVIIYPGHGETSTIGEERKHNMFLQK